MNKIWKEKKVGKFVALTMIVCLLFTITGCGEASDTEDAAQTESADSTATGAATDISDIISEISAATGSPEFFAEDFGEVDVTAALDGKKVMLVAYDSTNDWCVNYVKMENELLLRVGASPQITYCDGTADSWIQAIQSAVNQNYDAIDLFGISDIGQLESAINEAREAGVYVQDTHGTDISAQSTITDVSIGCDYTHAGELMAMKAIEQIGSAEDVNCLVIADVGWGADTNVRDGITSVFDEYGCEYTMADVAITDWTEGIGTAVTNAFIADDSYNAVIAYYDNMCLYVIPALESIGVNLDDVVIGSFNGSPGLVDYVKDGKLDFDIGESTGWCASHAVDCMARSFAGQTVYNDSGFAMYFITTDNIDDYINPETGSASYAYDGVQDIYLDGYSTLWGVDLTGVFDEIE